MWRGCFAYLGVAFQCNGAWDAHVKRVVDSGRKKVNQLHSVITNTDVNFNAHRLLLLSVVRPTLQYGNEVWEGNKTQAATLESVMLGGALQRGSKKGYGPGYLQGRRDKAKLKLWYVS